MLFRSVDGVLVSNQIRKHVHAGTTALVKCGKLRVNSSITMYVTRSGSGVISIGSMGWILHGFRRAAVKKFVVRVSSNILINVARGPLGLVLEPGTTGA